MFVGPSSDRTNNCIHKPQESMSEEKDSSSEAKRHEDSLAEKKELNSKELVEKIEAYFYTDDGMYVCMYVCTCRLCVITVMCSYINVNSIHFQF